jgi:SAM-dependent methyltransferase
VRRTATQAPVPLELTEEDRRYLSRRYDDGVPLPAGATEYLRADNPRLVQLRAAYDAVDSPAVLHSQWEPDNVAGYLDLQYFRGDSMIQWHYRELPRATRLKLFLYLSYLQERDTPGLLNRLPEDGMFGCWTYDYQGYPRVSRDLLDSVAELLFLHRHLSLLDIPGIRVLDVGAGYGRLAERTITAAPGLGDYCCVDAIPESTFLCEYYLGWRGLMPPARVLPLPELGQLQAGSFDLAVNVHSFSECTLAAVEWWVSWLSGLGVPHLFVIPNEPDGFLSRESDNSRRDLMPVLEQAGYRLQVREPVIADPALGPMLRIRDHFHLFRLEDSASHPEHG